MPVYRIEITERTPVESPDALRQLRAAGLPGLRGLLEKKLYFLEGALTAEDAGTVASSLLMDPVAETVELFSASAPPPGALTGAGRLAVDVLPRPGVMDPAAETALEELRAENWPVTAVRTGRRYELAGVETSPEQVAAVVGRVLANDCIEELFIGSAGLRPAPAPPMRPFELRTVAVCTLSDDELQRLSRSGHLFLSLDEMRAIQAHYRACGREPTDLELETLAQTWSEHCVHKTLRSRIIYRGAPLPAPDSSAAASQPAAGEYAADGEIERVYENLLKETVFRATRELRSAGRGPECLSVFEDNAGIIALDEDFGVAFKVETHNHPSAIEPYGGAATGIGGCIRDVIGCGLGARPIASTDVFCVAPGDWPHAELPVGVLHPDRVLRGVVRGVADYGNRMGIPTVNGAIAFDPRYLGNPLVFCGSIGLIPRDRIAKAARPGDLIVLIGGRTGRDGIHGATFSSAELSGTHADEFSHAVQIGNAITEKRVLDAVLRARDAAGGCLYHAITDCGAGGLSSAVGEMAAAIGAVVDLEQAPLKYAGLRYDEIWISEAQERMVLAVPPENLNDFLAVMRAEECEATVIGRFGQGPSTADRSAAGQPRLVVRYEGVVVGDLDMEFLHAGLPRTTRQAVWRPSLSPSAASPAAPAGSVLGRLIAVLASPNIASKEWVIRQYDHEVQGGSVIKPLFGPGGGPSDAAVVRPRLDRDRGVAVGCGLAPHWSDMDPYWMALLAVDEALRNVICVGADLRQTALLDNFCWGRTDDPEQLGALVRACQGCYDAAVTYGTPFISGKDSLNNEYTLDPQDIERLIETLERRGRPDTAAGPEVPDPGAAAAWRARLPGIAQRLRMNGRLSIPPTLLISALGIVPDVNRCVSADLKSARDVADAGSEVLLIGGLPPIGFALSAARRVHQVVSDLIGAGLLAACHDVSEGGWLVALVEMAVGGGVGLIVPEPGSGGFEELAAGYLVQTHSGIDLPARLAAAGVDCRTVAQLRADARVILGSESTDLATLRRAWSSPLTAKRCSAARA